MEEKKPTQTPKRSVRRIASLPPHLRCESEEPLEPPTKKPRIVPSMSGRAVSVLCSILVVISLRSPSFPPMLADLLPSFDGRLVGRQCNLRLKQLVKVNFSFLANPDTHLPLQVFALQVDLLEVKAPVRPRHRANPNSDLLWI